MLPPLAPHEHLPASEVLVFLLVDLVIVIVAARAMGPLMRRIRQPVVVGELLAGILLGPTVLGRIWPGAPQWLFPTDQVPLAQIANLGLIFFMFLVGLELDMKLVRQEGRRAFEISFAGILLPFALGMGLAFAMFQVNETGEFLKGVTPKHSQFAFAMFIGAAMCITAFPVLARILVETGLYKTSVGLRVLCAAAVDDACAWILLATVIGIANSGDPLQAWPTFLGTIVFVGLMLTAGRWLLGLLARRYDRLGRLSVTEVAIVIVAVLLAAFATDKIGIHAVFGPFIVGVCMPKRSRMTAELTDKIEDFTVIVLLPVFFAVTGLSTDLFRLNDPGLIGWTVLIVAVATAGKFIGTGLVARLTGSSLRDSVIIGSLMNTRGLTELVILSIGMSLGILSDRTFAMMVIMALVTTIIAAPVVNLLISRKELMRLLIGGGEAAAGEKPAARVLVALGNPQNARALVDAGIRLTGKRRPAELLLVRLIPMARAPQFRSGLQDAEANVAAAVESMQQLVGQATAAGVTARPISFLTEDVAKDLSRVAADQKCDAMLLGWHRASLEHRVIQELVHQTFLQAPCDVTVFVDREGLGVQPSKDKPVLAVLPRGAAAEAAARTAGHLAQSLGTGVRLAAYAGDDRTASAESEALARHADKLRQETGLWAVPVTVEGDWMARLTKESAAAAAAVIPVGADWATAVDFGTPTADLAEKAQCPVFVLRAAGLAGAPTPEPAAASAAGKSG